MKSGSSQTDTGDEAMETTNKKNESSSVDCEDLGSDFDLKSLEEFGSGRIHRNLPVESL
jgi:hypothetical protein